MISGTVGPGDHELDKSSLWLVSILGGELRKLRDEAVRATLSPDDSLVAYMGEDGIWLADADGASPRQFIETGARELVGSPVWSTDGKRVVYRRAVWGQDGLVATIESRGLDEETSTVLVDERPAGGAKNDTDVWSADFLMVGDRLVYASKEPAPRGRDENLWEITIDPRSGQPRGEPRRLTDWVGFGIRNLSATADGTRLVFLNDRSQEDVYIGELSDGGRRLEDPGRLTLDDRDDRPMCWTRDGRAVVFGSNRYGSVDLFVQGFDERAAQDLVLGAGDHGGALLTPDGAFVLYWDKDEDTSGPRDPRRMLRVPVGGGPTEVVLEAEGLAMFDCATRPDGPCLLIEVRMIEGVATVSRLDPVEGKGEELWSQEIDPDLAPKADLSPNGDRFAVVGHTERSRSIRLLDALTGEVIRDIEVKGAPGIVLNDVQWSPDGNTFYLIGESGRGVSLLRVDLQGNVDVLREDPTADLLSVRPSPDGRHLAFGKKAWDANIWVIENFRDP